jgi:transposase InsO family protein
MGQKVVTVEQKLAAVFADAEHLTVTAACEQIGISRQTFYKYKHRFAVEGLPGLNEQSRRPHSSPMETGEDMCASIAAARTKLAEEGWDNGALSIYYRLLHDGADPPHPRTIHRVLCRLGLVKHSPRKRPRSSYRRFVFPATDDCWSIDSFHYPCQGGVNGVVFQIVDDHSRSDVADLAWPVENTEGAWECASIGIARYGPPRFMLSDNGMSFTSRNAPNKRVLFEKNLAALGIRTITTRPCHPQGNGKNERAHQTAEKWLAAQPPASTLSELQTLMDRYRDLYNNRPHQALRGATPNQARVTGQRPQPLAAPIAEPMRALTTTIDHRGRANFQNARVPIGVRFEGLCVTVFTIGDHALVFHREKLLRELDLDRTRKEQAPDHPRKGVPHRRRDASVPVSSAHSMEACQGGVPAA